LRPTGTVRARRQRPIRRAAGALALGVAALTLTGCSAEEAARLGLPEGITDQTDRITNLWQGAWIAAFAVGALVWGLMLYAAVAYRRRRTDTGLPLQVRYNLPIEVTYTVLPVIMVLTYFYFTARDQDAILEVSNNPDNTINVVGKQWSWDFNYTDEGVFETGIQADPPTLYLPVNESTKFVLTARDVIHSFWVPAFQFKLDMIPGRINEFEITPTKTGTFAGRCAELCGNDHARMLFTLEVVERDVYDDYIESLRDAGQTGELPAEIGPGSVVPGEGQNPGNIDPDEEQPLGDNPEDDETGVQQ
jgi:cytochrome c oxidase subunit 2